MKIKKKNKIARGARSYNIPGKFSHLLKMLVKAFIRQFNIVQVMIKGNKEIA